MAGGACFGAGGKSPPKNIYRTTLQRTVNAICRLIAHGNGCSGDGLASWGDGNAGPTKLGLAHCHSGSDASEEEHGECGHKNLGAK
jgi:hypothetical protein